MLPYKYFIFEGGGMKGVAYARIPRVLKEFGITDIQKVAGSSAVSIIALLIALNFSDEDIEDLLNNMKFSEFADSSTYTECLWNLTTSNGINSGVYFQDYIRHLIHTQTGNPNINFAQLFEYTKIELVITGTNMTTGTTEYFSYKTTPEMEVWKAVRISIAIPVFFAPFVYNKNMYVDGGVLSNYPIWIFDNEDTYYPRSHSNHISHKTIGFRLVPEKIKTQQNSNPYFIPIISLIIRLIYLLVNHAYVGYNEHIAEPRTVCINTLTVDSTKFDIDENTKEKLKSNGERALRDFLQTKTIRNLTPSNPRFQENTRMKQYLEKKDLIKKDF